MVVVPLMCWPVAMHNNTSLNTSGISSFDTQKISFYLWKKYLEVKHEMGSTKKYDFFPYSKNPSSDVLIWTGYCIKENFSIEGMANSESEAAG